MVNVQKLRMLKSAGSNLNATSVASNSERVLRSSNSTSFCAAYADTGCTMHNAQNGPETLAHELKSGDEGPQFLPVQGQEPTLAPRNIIPKPLDNAGLRTTMQQVAEEEAIRIHSSRVKETKLIAVEKALSNTFHLGFKSANDGSKTESYYFVEQILMDVTQNGALDEGFDRNIEHCTQSSTFIDAIFRRALTSSRLFLPAAKFIRNKQTKQSHVIDNENSSRDFPFSFFESLSLSS